MAAKPLGPVLEEYHVYHAEAEILSGDLEHPIKQDLEKFGHVALEHTRRESLITRSVGMTNIEGLISFQSGRTRVAGTQVKQKVDIFGNDHAGWVTLSTATIEGYNVIDTVTADRVVAQISTEHPMKDGHIPRVSFLGTRFENFQVAGFQVPVELDFGLFAQKPDDDRSYLEDGDFLDRVERQFETARDTKGAPDGVKREYKKKIEYIDDLRRRAKKGAKGDGNGYPKLKCSLIKNIGEIPVPGVKTFGNVIFIPNFGTVALATLEVGIHGGGSEFRRRVSDPPPTQPRASDYFTLNMFEMNLGCPVGGKANGPKVSGNGQTQP